MKKIKKILLLFFLIPIFLILILLIVPFFIPKSYYLNFITETIEQRYPAKIDIKDARLSFFPYPAISLEDTHLKVMINDEEYPFISAKELSLATNWSGLLNKQLEVEIKLNQSKIDLVEIEPKVYHYQYLFREMPRAIYQENSFHLIKKAQAKVFKKEHGMYLTNNWMLFLEGVQISNTDLTIQSILKEKTEIKSIDANISEIFLGSEAGDSDVKSGKLEASFDLPLLKSRDLSFKTNFYYHSGSKELILKEGEFHLKGIPVTIEGSINLADIEPVYRLDIETKQLNMSKIKSLDLYPIDEDLKGVCDFKLNISGPTLSLDNQLKSNCTGIEVSKLGEKIFSSPSASLNGMIHYTPDLIEFKNIKINLDANELVANGSLKEENENKEIDFLISSKNIDLDWLQHNFYGLDFLSKAKGKLAFNTKLKGKSGSYTGSFSLSSPKLSMDVNDQIRFKEESFLLSANFISMADQLKLEQGELIFADYNLNFNLNYDLKKKIDFSLLANSLDLNDFSKKFLGKSEVDFKGLVDTKLNLSSNDLKNFKGKFDLSSIKLTAHQEDSFHLKSKILLNSSFSYDGEKIKTDQSTLTLDSSKITLKGNYFPLKDEYDLDIDGYDFNFNEVFSILLLDKSPYKILGQFNFSLNANNRNQKQTGSFALKSKDFTLDYPEMIEFSNQYLAIDFDFLEENLSYKLSNGKVVLGNEKMIIDHLLYQKEGYDLSAHLKEFSINFWQKKIPLLAEYSKIDGKVRLDINLKGNKGNNRFLLKGKSDKITSIINQKPISFPLDFDAEVNSFPDKTEIKKINIFLGDPKAKFSGMIYPNGKRNLSASLSASQSSIISVIYPEMKDLPEIKNFNGNFNYVQDDKNSKPFLSGDFKASEIKHPEYPLSKVSFDLKYSQNILRLYNLTATVLEGSLSGNVKVLLGREKPKYYLKLNLKDINLAKVHSLSWFVTGKSDFSLRAEGEGFAESDWEENLKASGKLTGNHLEFPRLKLLQDTLSDPAWQLLAQKPGLTNNNNWSKLKSISTSIDSISTNYFIKNGAIILPDNELKVGDFGLDVGGKIFVTKKLDIRGILSLPQKNVYQLINDKKIANFLLDGKKFLPIPLKIIGTTKNPKVVPDTSIIKTAIVNSFKSTLTEEIQQKVESKAKEDLKKEVKKKIDEVVTEKDKKDMRSLEEEIKKWFD